MSGIEIEDEGGGEVRRIEGENKKNIFSKEKMPL